MSGKGSPVSGLLNIDKPKGITSHDVVARVRKLTRQHKVGHTGTLDPMATGVLLVCLGQATRLIEYMISSPKKYRATIRFGISTETLDAEGKIIAQRDLSALSEIDLHEALLTFLGEIEQVPPVFSALKKDGQPLYKRARAGETVQVDPRPVTIYDLAWVAWHPPDLTVDVTCSPGTYVRALARDVGEAVGTGAHLTELIRTANGDWTLDQAVALGQLEQMARATDQGWQKYLYPPDQAIEHLPKAILDDDTVRRVKYGRNIQLDSEMTYPSAAIGKKNIDVVRAYTPAGDFLAILKSVKGHDNIWQPRKVFQI